MLYSGAGTWAAPMGACRLFQVLRFFGISEVDAEQEEAIKRVGDVAIDKALKEGEQ